MRLARCHGLVAGLTLLTSLAAGAQSAASMADKEAAVRAAFLYRLAFFVNWDPASFADPDSPLRFCVVGDAGSRVAPLLREHTRGRSVGERRVEVEQHAPGAALAQCHLVYLERDARYAEDSAAGKLIVVDSLDGLQHGGTLALLAETEGTQEKRLGFVSRRDNLARSGVSLNARLLQLVRFEDEDNGS
jgi:hypothetical protein